MTPIDLNVRVWPIAALMTGSNRPEAVTRRVYETRGDSGNYSQLCRR